MKQSSADQLRRENEDDDVTASEVAAYAYCAKAWHLERVLNRSPGTDGERRRAEGVERHVEHGARLNQLHRFGQWSWRVSAALLLLGLVLLAAAVLL